MTLMLGDCREVLKTLADASVDSVVCDPPYELGFMGKAWDGTGVAYDVALWRQVLRVLKPGGHLLAFGGSRTYHRLACAVEDAGFEIRDQIMWVYGSGFPKSLDVSKAIDKAAGAEREVVGSKLGLPGYSTDGRSSDVECAITAPATDEARQWSGWGTALKPAHEPIVVARKPLIGTVAENVLAFGTGAINVDGCRVSANGERLGGGGSGDIHYEGWGRSSLTRKTDSTKAEALGRWPANLIHDGSAEVVGRFPETTSNKMSGRHNGSSLPKRHFFGTDSRDGELITGGYGDTGSAARFFYTAKADATDRDQGLEGFAISLRATHGDTGPSENAKPNGQRPVAARNTHPTVKPTELMRYLCRLVTPPGGIVLDPFMGSGSTGKAAALERFDFIGIELDPDYLEIARARIAWLGVAPAVQGKTPREVQPPTNAQLALSFA